MWIFRVVLVGMVLCAVLMTASVGFAQKGQAVERKVNRYVVAMGVNAFEHPPPEGSTRDDEGWEPLRFAEKDAQEVVEALEYYGFKPFDDTILLGEEATSHAMWQLLVDLRKEIHRHGGEDYEIIVYLSSHGFNLDPEGNGHGFIVTHNTPARRDFNLSRKEEAISQRDILEHFVGELGPNVLRTAIIYDACETPGGKGAASRFRGPASAMSMKDARRDEKSVQQIRELAQTTYVFSAVSRNQPAVEPDRLGNGVYTHFLLEALRSGREGPASELLPKVPFSLFAAHQFATHKVRQWTKGRQYPSWAAPRVNEAEGLFFLWPEGTPERQAALDQRSLIITQSPSPPGMLAVLIPDGGERLRGARDVRRELAMGGGTIVSPGRYVFRLVDEEDGSVHVETTMRLSDGQIQNLNLMEMLDSRPRQLVTASVGFGGFSSAWGQDPELPAMPMLQLSYGISGWPGGHAALGLRFLMGGAQTASPVEFDTTVDHLLTGLSLEFLGEGRLGLWSFGAGPMLTGALVRRHVADIGETTLTSAWGGGVLARVQAPVFEDFSVSLEGQVHALAIGNGNQGVLATTAFLGLTWHPVLSRVERVR